MLYFKVVIQGKKNIKGYVFREIKTYPIVGHHYYKGYELINVNNKVLYRRVKDWGTIYGSLRMDNYKIVKRFFFKNVNPPKQIN